MIRLRTSNTGDVPRLRELWKLAFGDEDAYIDHFFTRYYAPERMVVLEEAGVVQVMTAWFDMPLVFANGTRVPSAYLYAVATHPDCRGRGLAGQLLRFADRWLEEKGYACVSTVPARPDLHRFFGQNGFRECFSLCQWEYRPVQWETVGELLSVDAEEYNRLREQWLEGTDHVAYALPALEYQSGVCALSGGGLYRIGEKGCACVERAGDEVFIKELLCPLREQEWAMAAISEQDPTKRYWVRVPYEGQGERWNFAMLKWLIPAPEWEKKTAPYLGLAFD